MDHRYDQLARLSPDQGSLGQRLDDIDGSADWNWDDIDCTEMSDAEFEAAVAMG